MITLTENDRSRIQKKISTTYVPLKKLIFEDNGKEVHIVRNFTDYSHVLARIEMTIHCFGKANPRTKDEEILSALKRIREDPLYESSYSEEDALAFAITYAMSQGLQEKRLAINEVKALLDWLIYEVEGRMKRGESYIAAFEKFLNGDKEGLK
ncbi:MAG: hypothetical protein AB1668_03170 [Nanoarchaeota archaeon]